MKNWQIVAGLFGLALAGCHNDPSVALLERDNFRKEQEIYRLKDRVEELEGALNAAAPAGAPIVRGVPGGEMPPEPRVIEGGRSAPPSTRPGPTFAPSSPAGEPPASGLKLDMGTEVKPGEVPERLKVPGDNPAAPRVAPPGGPSSGGPSQWNPAGGQSLTGSKPVDNGSVAQITLHPALTGGIGTGARSGDEGLLVVVEPRDFGGNIVNVPGNVSVALLDPALSGEQARLARWDFAAAEAQGMIRAGSQPGIHLRLPWPAAPAHDRVKVFVRYTTRDGRKLQAERLISVALNDPRPAPHEALPAADSAQTASRPQRPQWSPLR